MSYSNGKTYVVITYWLTYLWQCSGQHTVQTMDYMCHHVTKIERD